MGRKRKNTRRVELRLDMDDVAMQRLAAEADARGVELQQHIVDILIARFLNPAVAPPPPDEPPAAPPSSAAALADEWM